MGGLVTMCGCSGSASDITGFWKSIELRKLSFDEYQVIFESNQRKWLSSGENKRSVDLRKCPQLYHLLDSQDFSEKQRTVYFDKLNEYINEQSDKLTFFTSLAFFTRISKTTEMKQTQQAENILDTLRKEEKTKTQDHLYNNLIKMAIKRTDHDDVTKFFIEFITEFPLQFIYAESKKEMEEKMVVYSQTNRDKLFSQIKMMNNQKFYEYMFNRENVMMIHDDLLKIQLESGGNDLIKIRTGANVGSTPTPGQ
jgi:hypothetical protein